jgi:hypothetical protein
MSKKTRKNLKTIGKFIAQLALLVYAVAELLKVIR